MTDEVHDRAPGAPPTPGGVPARPATGRPWWRSALRIAGWTAVAVLAVAAVLALVPVSTSGYGSDSDPAADYDEAVQRFEALAGQEDDVYGPCASRLLTHGGPTDVVVVLVHGLTNCPKQFVDLGEEIHESGANVLILRMPYHGLASDDGASIGSVSNVGAIRAEDFRDYADEVIDIAAGLGEDVRVLGLSAGGVVTAWTAQYRAEVSRTVVISPAISLPGGMPDIVDYGFRNFFSRLPNLSLPSGGKLDHAYAGESTRALAAMYTLAKAVEDGATDGPPAAGSIVVVTNANDDQVDNGDIREHLVEVWRAAGANVETYEFPKDLGLRHDLIDVDQPDEQTDLVYPKLIELLGL
jgi:carboxylesterase